jgi:hypothetical protein
LGLFGSGADSGMVSLVMLAASFFSETWIMVE